MPSKKLENPIVILNRDQTIELEVVSGSIIRVTIRPHGLKCKEKFSVASQRKRENQYANWTSEASKDGVCLKTANGSVHYEDATNTLSFFNTAGELLLSEISDNARRFFITELNGHTLYGVEQVFSSPEGEVLEGMGQHTDRVMNYRGRFLHMNQYNTIIPVPLLVSNRGYGVLWDNPSLTELNPEKQEIPIWFEPDFKNWHGIFTADEDGEYNFIYEKLNRNMYTERVSVYFDDQAVIERETHWNPNYFQGSMTMEKGRTYPIVINGTGRLYFQRPSQKKETVLWSESGGYIDYYFIFGPEPDDIVKAYRYLTGNAPMFPKWAFGYWQSRERYKTMRELLEVAQEYRRRKYPLDVMVQDWQYWRDSGWNAMKFHSAYSEDAAADIHRIHEMNLHIALSVWPNYGDEPQNELYRKFKQKGYILDDTRVIKQTGGSKVLLQGVQKNFYDVMNEDARKQLWDEMDKGLFVKGIDAWWVDADEPNLSSIQGTYHQYETCLGPAAEYLNLYPYLHCKGIYEGQRKADDEKRVCILSRGGFAGQQAFGAAVWSGDINGTWDVFRAQIVAGLNYSLSGNPYWGTDIGGFVRQNNDEDYKELYIRWFQFAVFTPIFRAHGSGSEREIWSLGEEVEKKLVPWLKLRYRLLPYIYSLAWRVTKQQYTILRPLMMDYRHDPDAQQINDQFMFGPAIMVCPVIIPEAVERNVYLPTGGGFYSDGRYYEGGKTICLPAPLETMPLLVREGSILITGPDVQFAQEEVEAPLTVSIYAGKDCSFVLYEDEGDSYRYEKGAFTEIPFVWSEAAGELTIGARNGAYEGMQAQRRFCVKLVRAVKNENEYEVFVIEKEVTYNGLKIVLVENGNDVVGNRLMPMAEQM